MWTTVLTIVVTHDDEPDSTEVDQAIGAAVAQFEDVGHTFTYHAMTIETGPRS